LLDDGTIVEAEPGQRIKTTLSASGCSGPGFA